MKNRYKLIILSIPVLLLTIVSLGTTYSLWTVSGQQTTLNEAGVGCFTVSFSETGRINLVNAYPISDAKAAAATPTYSFTITNTCSITDSYQINLETMNSSTLNPKWVKAAIQKTHENGTAVSSSAVTKLVKQNTDNNTMSAIDYFTATSPTYTIANNIVDPNDNTNVLISTDAGILMTGTLASSSSVTYSLKLYITEEATMNDVGLTTNNKYYARVVVLHNAAIVNNNINANLLSVGSNRSRSLQLIPVTTLENAISSYVYDDNTSDHNLRYMGADVNNYVLFNGENWRIVGIFNSVSDGNGNTDSRIKLVRATGISTYWSENNNVLFNTSDIPTQLNSILSSSALDYIDNASWNSGTTNGSVSALESYSLEKNDTWSNSVGILSASDYGLASLNSTCRTNTDLSNYSSCVGSNYLYNSNDTWLMNTSTSKALYVNSAGNVLESDANVRKNIYPTVYLKSGIKVSSGDGSISNPYILSDN